MSLMLNNIDDLKLRKGSGINLAGEGWKTGVGSTLIGLGGLETYGYAKSGGIADIAAGIIGGSILAGIGGLLIASDKKKGRGMSGGMMMKRKNSIFDKHFKQAMIKNIKKYRAGGAIKGKDIENFMQKHKDKKIHIRDIFGPKWKSKGKILYNAIVKHSGGGIFSKIGKLTKTVVNKSRKKLKQFVEGKTKFKPSTLANVLAGAVSAAGMASSVIPGVDLISVPTAIGVSTGLKVTGQALKLSGRGMYNQMGKKGGRIMPAQCYKSKTNEDWEKCFVESQKQEKQREIAANLARMRGRGIMKQMKTPISEQKNTMMLDLYKPKKKMKKMKGGQLEDLIELTPTEELIANIGDAALIASALGITAAAAHKLIKYVKSKRGGALKLAGMGKKKKKKMPKFNRKAMPSNLTMDEESPMTPKGMKIPPGVTYTSGGKIKRDRYSVYYGFYKKTSGGLTKDDFIKKGNKIVSKRKSMMGKKIAEANFKK